jgi:SAM-dependent methyltransferase
MDAPHASAWFESPLGRSLLELEQRVIGDALGNVFGFELLQVGRWGAQLDLCSAARTQHHRCIAPDATGPRAIRADFAALPIATASVEAVLLPHTLEYAAHPHELLREVERVLVGEGHVLACGFNPLGPWGLRHLLARRRYPPPARRLLSEGRLTDWLRLLGLEVVDSRRYLFQPPWQPRFAPRGRDWLERRGPSLLPPLAGAYFVKARKRVRGLTPLRPAWQRAPALVGGLAEPTSRIAA